MRRYAALVAGLLALAAITAPAAQADHVTASVSATLALGEAVKTDCDDSGLCARGRRATVSWNAACGPGGTLDGVTVAVVGIRADGSRFTYDEEPLDSTAPPTGSVGLTAGRGLRFAGEVEAVCYAETTNADGDLVVHRARATATTAAEYLPPELVAARTTYSSFCGVVPPPRMRDRVLQAGSSYDLAWFMRFSGASLLRRGVPAIRQIRLFARGAGVRLRRAPSQKMLRQFGYTGTYVNPRRAGRLRIWATINGHRTNTMRVRVLPRRC